MTLCTTGSLVEAPTPSVLSVLLARTIIATWSWSSSTSGSSPSSSASHSSPSSSSRSLFLFPLPLPLLFPFPFPLPLVGKGFFTGSAPSFLDGRLSGCFSQQSEATWPLFPQCLQRFGLGHSDCMWPGSPQLKQPLLRIGEP